MGLFDDLTPPEKRRNGLTPPPRALSNPMQTSGLFGDLTTPPDDLSYTKAFSHGLDTAGTSLHAAGKALGLSNEKALARSVAEDAAVEQPKYMQDYYGRLQKQGQEFEAAKGFIPSLKEGVDIVGEAVSDPKALGYAFVENLPFSAPAMAGAAGGAKLGAMTAPVTGPWGALGGAVIGGFLGGLAPEFGAKYVEEISSRAKDPTNADELAGIMANPEFNAEAEKKGLLKGAGIAAVDAMGMLLGGRIGSAPGRALQKSINGTLERHGVNIADEMSRKAALSNKAILDEIAAPVEAYRKATSTPAKLRRGAGAFGLETLGEGGGEAFGQYLADGTIDPVDVVLESILGGGQSAVQAMVSTLVGEKATGADQFVEAFPGMQQDAAGITSQAQPAGSGPGQTYRALPAPPNFHVPPGGPAMDRGQFIEGEFTETPTAGPAFDQQAPGGPPAGPPAGPLTRAANRLTPPPALPILPPDPMVAMPDGSVATQSQLREMEAADLAETQRRAELGLSPDVERAAGRRQYEDSRPGPEGIDVQEAENIELGPDAVPLGHAPGIDVEETEAKPIDDRPDYGALARPQVKETTFEAEGLMPPPRAEIDTTAHEAATSPTNRKPQPTPAQKEAGNYAKGHLSLHGMDISVENPAGSVRSGTDEDGKVWETRMATHYGYIKGTKGKDKDHLDVFLGDDAADPQAPVFVVDQQDPKTGKFDEHKVLIGFRTEADARLGYEANYKPGWTGLKAITPMSMPEFKQWTKGDTTRPVAAAAFRAGERAEARDQRIAEQRERLGEAKMPPGMSDPRFKRDAYRSGIQAMANELVRGGDISLVPDKSQYVTGKAGRRVTTGMKRTPSINPQWFQDFGVGEGGEYKPTVDELQWTVEKALKGERLGVRQNATILTMMDLLEGERAKDVDHVRSLLERARLLRREGFSPTRADLEYGTILDEGEYRPEWTAEDRLLRDMFDEAVAINEPAAERILERMAIQGRPSIEIAEALDALINGEDYGKITGEVEEGKPGGAADTGAAPGGQEVGKKAAEKKVPKQELTPPPLALAQQTEEELRAIDERRRADEARKAEEDKKAAEKAKADRERGEFVLSGSDRMVDIMEAHGQRSIFDEIPLTPPPKAETMAPRIETFDSWENKAGLEIKVGDQLRYKSRGAGTSGQVSDLEIIVREIYKTGTMKARVAALGSDRDFAVSVERLFPSEEGKSGKQGKAKAKTEVSPEAETGAGKAAQDGRDDSANREIGSAEQLVWENAGQLDWENLEQVQAAHDEVLRAQALNLVLGKDRISGSVAVQHVARVLYGRDAQVEHVGYGRQRGWYAQVGDKRSKPLGMNVGSVFANVLNNHNLVGLKGTLEVLKARRAEEEKNAKRKQEAGGADENVRQPAGQKEGQGEVPAQKGSEGVRGSGQAPEVDAAAAGAELNGEIVTPFPYWAGTSRPRDFDAALDSGAGAGVVIGELSEPMKAKVVQAVHDGKQVFVDSGAFSIYRQAAKEGRDLSQTTIEEWTEQFDQVMAEYKALSDQIRKTRKGRQNSGSLMLVMPDVVGNQDMTKRLLDHYKEQIAELEEAGHELIVPIQVGKISAGEMYQAIRKDVFDGVMANVVIGIPSNKEAMSPGEFERLIRVADYPARIHILGAASPNNKAFQDRVATLQELYEDRSDVGVTADAMRIRSVLHRLDGLAGEEKRKAMVEALADGVPDAWKPGQSITTPTARITTNARGTRQLKADMPADELAQWRSEVEDIIARWERIGDQHQASVMRERLRTGPLLGFYGANDKFVAVSSVDTAPWFSMLEGAERRHAIAQREATPLEYTNLTAETLGKQFVEGGDIQLVPGDIVDAVLDYVNQRRKKIADMGIKKPDTRTFDAYKMHTDALVAISLLDFMAKELVLIRDKSASARPTRVHEHIERLNAIMKTSFAPPAAARLKHRIQPWNEQRGTSSKNVAKLLYRMGLEEEVVKGEEFHRRISNNPYLDLVIERHPDGRLFLTHYIEMGGDQVLDSEMVFQVDDIGRIWLHETAVRSLAGEFRSNDTKFANTFSKTLLDQGFAEAGFVPGQDLVAESAKITDRQLEKMPVSELKNLAKARKIVGLTSKADLVQALGAWRDKQSLNALPPVPEGVRFTQSRFTKPDSSLGYVASFERYAGLEGITSMADGTVQSAPSDRSALGEISKHFGGTAWASKKESTEYGEGRNIQGFHFPSYEKMVEFLEHVIGRRMAGYDETKWGQQGEFMPAIFETPQEQDPLESVKPESASIIEKATARLEQAGRNYKDFLDWTEGQGYGTELWSGGDRHSAAVVDDYLAAMKREGAPAEGAEKPAAPQKPSNYGKKNKIFTQEKADAALDLLKGRLGRLNAGLDPEMMQALITRAGYHIEAGARAFVDYARAMIEEIGEAVIPYLKWTYNSVRDYPGFDATGMTPQADITDELMSTIKTRSKENVPSSNSRVERDSEATDGVAENEGAVQPSDRAPGPGPGRAGGSPGGSGTRSRRDSGVPVGGSATVRTEGNPDLFGDLGQYDAKPGPAGSGGSRGSGGPGGPGVSTGSSGAARAEDAAAKYAESRQKQDAADKIPVKPRDADNIKETLPLLFGGQQQDVLFAENRLAEGRGIMFTNGTGTGKTFTGLGIAKRFARQGMDNILIIAPSKAVGSEWIKAGKLLGLDITRLADTGDSGTSGPVVTTYANFWQNDSLLNRQWDLIIPDESHRLTENKSGGANNNLRKLRALTGHPLGLHTFAEAKERPLLDRMTGIQDNIQNLRKSNAPQDLQRIPALQAQVDKLRARWNAALEVYRADRAEHWSNQKTKVVFLSATPFAYERSIDLAEGFLFNYPPDDDSGAYNAPSGRESFMIEHFGYRMRTGKLNEPEAGVDRGLMQREFNQWLKREGVLSGRRLEVEHDYSREFVAIDDLVGNKIDEGFEFVRERAFDRENPMHVGYQMLLGRLNAGFKFHERMRLLEAIKAKHAIPRIKQHLAMGRKVVVFHSRIQGGAFHPFHFSKLSPVTVEQLRENPEFSGLSDTELDNIVSNRDSYNEAVDDFNDRRSDLVNLDLDSLLRTLDRFREAFGDRMTTYNGTLTEKQKAENPKLFQADASGKDVLVVLDEAGKEGISLHDTTGAHQRVLVNLGLPFKPTMATQIEGRIYRVGNASHAIYEYFNTGTFFERFVFATGVATKSSTAENLALGNESRNLLDSFVEAFENPTIGPPGAHQGVGGKEMDQAVYGEISGFLRAKTHYWATQKNTRRRDQRQGVDYFATPEPLGFKMVEWAEIRQNQRAMEPSAGHGAIARYFPETSSNTFIEPSSELASKLSLRAKKGKVRQMIFEDLDVAANKYDAIVLNPPFGQGGKTAFEHLQKAMKHLRNGGRIVALMPEGSDQIQRRFDKLMDAEENKNFHIMADFGIPYKAFVRAGTSIKTHVLVIDRYDDHDLVPYQRGRVDFEPGTEDINDFFDAIEDATVPERAEVPVPASDVLENGHGIKVAHDPESGQWLVTGKTYEHLENLRKAGGMMWDSVDKAWVSNDDPSDRILAAITGADVPAVPQPTPFNEVIPPANWTTNRLAARAYLEALGVPTSGSESLQQYGRFIELRLADIKQKREFAELHPDLAGADIQRDENSSTVGDFSAIKEKAYHQKRDVDIYRVRLLGKRLSRATFVELKTAAEAQNGYFSNYSGQGAKPGFVFDTQEQADAFLDHFGRIVEQAGPRASRRPPLITDFAQQSKWLSDEAKRLGYESADDMLISDPDRFMELAARWRDEHGERAGSVGSVENLRAELSKGIGRARVNELERKGLLHLVQSSSELPAGMPSDTQGVWDGSAIWIVADNALEGDSVGVLLHESEHAGMKALLGNTYADIQAKFDDLLRARDPAAMSAMMRVPQDTPTELIDSERLAYFIEEANGRLQALPGNLSEAAAALFRRIANAIKAWFRQTPLGKSLARRGIDFALTDGYVVALARQALVAAEQRLSFAEQAAGAVQYHTAFHGSGSDFDTFSLHAIGSGEGSQSYGWGLYFAEHKDVAEFYRKKLGGAEVIYQVDLAPNIEDYLNWDLPIAKQSPQVRKAIEQHGLVDLVSQGMDSQYQLLFGEFDDSRTGAELYRELAQIWGGPVTASKFLGATGIPGIRFKDRGSRSSEGTGTYNYVVWDDSLIRIERKAPEGAQLSRAMPILEGKLKLRRHGLKPGVKNKVRQVAEALQSYTRERTGKIPLNDFSAAAEIKIARMITDEIRFEMAPERIESSGIGWYTKKYPAGLDALGRREFPELLTDPVARSMFTVAMAVLSNGQTVSTNMLYAIGVYRQFRETGRFEFDIKPIEKSNNEDILDEDSETTATTIRDFQTAFGRVNDIIDKYGRKGASEKLLEVAREGDLRKEARESGFKFSSGYAVDTVVPYAALLLGPKLGAFFANLSGNAGYLTMDRWWSRTFNRYRGTLIPRITGNADKPTDASGKLIGLALFKQRLGAPDISDDTALIFATRLRDALKDKKYRNGTALEKQANTIYKQAFEATNDTPKNKGDRTFMIRTVKRAQANLARSGYTISVSDIQAALWYLEKRLYATLGSQPKLGISYEQAIENYLSGADAGRAAEAVRPGGDDRAVDEGLRVPGGKPGKKEGAAQEGLIQPSRRAPGGRTAPTAGANPVLEEALRRAGLGEDSRSTRERISDWAADAWAGVTGDLKDRMLEGVFDQFHGIKTTLNRFAGNLPAEQNGYVASRLSTGLPSVLYGVLNYGSPVWRDGVLARKEGSKGLLQILEPVKANQREFFGWMIARRAQRLMAEGREHNLEQAHVDQLMALHRPEFDQVAEDLAEFNRSILDVAQEAGLIDAETRPAWEHADYIPFYRVGMEGKVKGPRDRKGLSHQSSGIRRLRGGAQVLNDPMANLARNMSHLLDASLKNHAIRQVSRNLQGTEVMEEIPSMQFEQKVIPLSQVKKLLQDAGMGPFELAMVPPAALRGFAKMWAIKPPQAPDIVRIMDNGKAKYFKVHDDALLRGLTAVNQEAMGGVVGVMRDFKRLLTTMVTAEPTFMARNFLRDALHAWTINEDKFKLGVDSFRGAAKTLREEGGMIDMLFSGASFLGGYVNANDPNAMASAIRRALAKKGFTATQTDSYMRSLLLNAETFWDKWRHWGDAVENANREAVFEAGGRAGKSKAQRVYESRDLLDYSMRGNFAVIRLMGDVLPFFNARLQGLYKLARAGAVPIPGAIKKRIIAKGGMIALASIALLILNKDRDEYEELEDWDKDSNWHFWIGDTHFRIPKPFELGLIYGTMPERWARLMLQKDDAEKTFERMGWAITSTLETNPFPQIIRPFVETWANENMFTGRPIEGLGDEGKLPQARYNERTSDTMRLLGDLMGASPKQLEHLWRGYLGTLGVYLLGGVDMLTRAATGAPEEPALRADSIPVLRAFYREDPPFSTKYRTELYDMLKEVRQTWATIRDYNRQGRGDAAADLLATESGKLRYRKMLEKAQDRILVLRKRMDEVERSGIDPKSKRIQIDQLTQQVNAISRVAVVSAKPGF